VTVKRFIDQHNKNASAVKSMSAEPKIVASGDGRRWRVNGLMALERPRGFRLDLRGTGVGQVADIGSNDQEFWFWVKDNQQKAIYVCNHKDVNASQLAVTYQPDWIIEAMGLREIDAREAATLAAKPGDKPGLIVLTQARHDNHGAMLTKETIVDETNGHIIEHRLWAGAKKELLARATVSQYFGMDMKPTDEDNPGGRIELPEKFRLEWVADKFALDVTMDRAKINPKFAPEKRVGLFTEPTFPGTKRLDLAQLGGPAANGSKVYESMPAPRSGVRLGQPEPMEVEGGLRTRSEPQPLSVDLSSTADQPTGVIGAPIPRGSDPEAVQASVSRGAWRPRPALLDR
jgi:hypothetical protein